MKPSRRTSYATSFRVDVQIDRGLHVQGPAVREPALELGAQDATVGVEGGKSADDELGALFVVQPEARGKEEVVLEYVGRPSASPVASPLGEQTHIGVRVPHGIEGVFAARDESRVVIFLISEGMNEPTVLRAGAVDRFQLENPVAGGELGIQAELADLLVVRRQDKFRVGERRQKSGFAARAVEYAEPDVEWPEAAAVSAGEVEMPLSGRRLVRGQVLVHDQRGAQTTVRPRKGARAVPGQSEQLQRPPVPPTR